MSHEELLTAYAALVEQHKKGLTTAKRPPKKTQHRDNKRRKGRDNKGEKEAADPDRACEYYCYVHGKQNSHASPQCKVMLNDRANFTDPMRRARSSRDVPGGSTSVRGQTGQTVAASGFMVTDYTVSVDAESRHAPAEPYDGEYCPQGRHVPPEAEFETRRPSDALAMTQVRAQIAHALTLRDHVPEFRQGVMPGKQTNPALHTYMYDVWKQREQAEDDLMRDGYDVNAAGETTGQRDSAAYQAACQRHNKCNRDLWHAFATHEVPPAPTAPIQEASSSTAWRPCGRTLYEERQRAAARQGKHALALVHKREQQQQAATSEPDFVSNHQPRKRTKTTRGHQALAATDSLHRTPAADEECPYGHARNGPQLAPTVPVFDPFPTNRLDPNTTTATKDDPVAIRGHGAHRQPTWAGPVLRQKLHGHLHPSHTSHLSRSGTRTCPVRPQAQPSKPLERGPATKQTRRGCPDPHGPQRNAHLGEPRRPTRRVKLRQVHPRGPGVPLPNHVLARG
jgi:hypothetical protein